MRLIDKDAVVAEIERRIAEYKEMKIDSSYYEGMVASLEFFRDEFINTLEVKEVDLKKEVNHFVVQDPLLSKLVKYDDALLLAKHFFKLGLCTSLREEDMKLVWTIASNLPEIKGEDFYKEILKRFKAQEGE